MPLKIINTLLRILLGGVFIASALLKLFPIELFEFNFVNLGVANWYTAPFIARLLIGVEYALGFMLVFNIYLLRFTLKATLVLLVFFTVYLCIEILSQGNNGNCGCFGTYLQMTPLQSILKNIAMMAVAYWLFFSKAQFEVLPEKFRAPDMYFAIPIIIASLTTPFILNPVDLNPPKQFDKNQLGYTLDLSHLYAETNHERPEIDLRKGKYVLALLSLSCTHCRTAGFKMHVMYERHPEIPFYFLLRGNAKKYMNEFYANTRATDIPHTVYNDEDFLTLAGGEVPAIFWLQDGKVVNRSNYIDMKEEEILQWLNAPNP